MFNPEIAGIQMPRYRCIKDVYALYIGEVITHVDSITLVFDNPNYASKLMDRSWAAKHEPQAGGYYVVYKDGYQSYSPAKAFEEGYICMYDED